MIQRALAAVRQCHRTNAGVIARPGNKANIPVIKDPVPKNTEEREKKIRGGPKTFDVLVRPRKVINHGKGAKAHRPALVLVA